MPKRRSTNLILYLSTYPPRECGIATFTNDLAVSFDQRFNPKTKSKILALNENETTFYNYPSNVVGSIAANHLEHYVALAEDINNNDDIKLVNIQHEFGIFGGEWGDYLIPFLQVLKKPIIVTFHSILANPDEHLVRTVQLINGFSSGLIVMNSRSKETLENDYHIPKSKIFLIPHGIPHTTFEATKIAKKELGLEGHQVLSTFGLVSRDKGLEYAIRAMPKVINRFPNALYLILGITHPVVRQKDGEEYRNFLINEVARLGMQDHVRFYNKFLTIDEIINYLKATDVYISTPLNPQQSVSGTLSYAMGCGRAVISTPTEYAKHLVRDNNGLLVKFKNPASTAHAICQLLEDEKYLKSAHIGAYESTRHMTWPNVVAAYFKIYKKFADLDTEERKLPDIKLDHIKRLTDDFGILHHARYSKPEKRFGYSLDDNARALIVVTETYEHKPDPELIPLIKTYLKFMKFVTRPSGTLANIVTSAKQKDTTLDEDVQGRALWVLGRIASSSRLPDEITTEANRQFKHILKSLPRITAPRATAFAMTGLYHYLKAHPQKKLLGDFRKLANRQVRLYRSVSSPNWQWFEDCLTYSNSKLAESLYYAYELTGQASYLEIAESALTFLSRVTFEPRHYAPIGQNGWYFRYKKRAYFDQQPEDTASMVETKLVAYKVTGSKHHLDDAYKAFQWFLGKNHLNLMVYNEVTGGCHDGLGQHAINLNQGAESTTSYLLARLAFEDPGITTKIKLS